MSFTAVRKLTVVSFFVIGGILISCNLFAGTAPYSSLQYSTIDNIWGTTFDDKPGNYNKGMYYTGIANDPNRDYGVMPQEDTTTISKIDAPFLMANTSWCPTSLDTATQKPMFQTYNPGDCSPDSMESRIYAMNDTDHIYLALDIEAQGINCADRLFLYFDPDNISPVPEFVEGSGYCVGVKLGNITFQGGVGNTTVACSGTESGAMDFCNGHWKDWDNSGSIDTWEAAQPWPYIGAQNERTYPIELDTGNKDDLTIVPRRVADWGDGSGGTTFSGAYWDNPDTLANGFDSLHKTGMIQMQFKIPLEQLGCSVALGADIGFAIQWSDDMDNDKVIDTCTYEDSWWPTDIQNSGTPGAGWEKYDAAYMGSMKLDNQNAGDRLWGSWFDVKTDRTSYLVLKNVSNQKAKTKVKFYGSVHGDQTERWAPLPGAGALLYSECVEIEPHGVATLQLETINGGTLMDKKGCIEVTNVDLAGYVVAYVGLDSGALQRYAWSTDLEMTPLTSSEWSTAHNNTPTTGMMLANKWYIVGEPGWDFNTSVVLVNPNPTTSATARIVLYPSRYLNPEIVPDTPNLCADIGFHPDFDGDYTGTSKCGDITGDADDVINLPPHQAVELRMYELLNYWVAHWNPQDVARGITDSTNTYWHFRKGTVEIFVQDGNDSGTDRLGEVLLGVTARESAFQGWAEALQRYYE